MRYKMKKITNKRYKKTFALFPIQVKDEVRWLEKVCIYQVYKYDEWTDVSFIDDEDIKKGMKSRVQYL